MRQRFRNHIGPFNYFVLEQKKYQSVMDGAPRSPCSHVTIRRWTRVGSRFRFSVRRWSAFGFIRLIKAALISNMRVFYSRRDKQVIVNCHVCVLSVQETVVTNARTQRQQFATYSVCVYCSCFATVQDWSFIINQSPTLFFFSFLFFFPEGYY